MTTGRFETTDIFRSAFFLCKGGDLSGIRFKPGGRRTAVFLITGHRLSDLDREYRTGQALVNPVQLRDALNRLRDVLFEHLREREGRRSHDKGRCY